MKTLIFCLLLSSFAFGQTSARPPSDPCRKATTQLEMNQCMDEKFHAAEDEMQNVYRNSLQQLAKDEAGASGQEKTYAREALADLRATQQAWVTYRDLQCRAESGQNAGGSIRPMVFSSCLEALTRDRTRQLHATYDPQ